MRAMQLEEQVSREVDEVVDGATLQDYLLFAGGWAKDHTAADTGAAGNPEDGTEQASDDMVPCIPSLSTRTSDSSCFNAVHEGSKSC
jgi:hypothetical protein